MADLLEIAERLWNGEGSTDVGGHHPVTQDLGLAEVADRTAFSASFGNICAFDTDDGLLLVDTGNQVMAAGNHERIRGWNTERLGTVVYTHGHIDHVFGMAPFEEEAQREGVGAAARRGPRARAAALRALRAHRWLQRRDQPAAVPVRPPVLADRLPPPRRGVPPPPHPRGRRRDVGAPPRQGRDRRRHLGVEPRPQGALHRRPLHLGQPQLRQPAEGAALPPRVGDRPPQDGGPRRRGAAARPRLPDPRRRPDPGRPAPTPPSCSSRWSSRRWR